jgi:hypothetical protein
MARFCTQVNHPIFASRLCIVIMILGGFVNRGGSANYQHSYRQPWHKHALFHVPRISKQPLPTASP